jgi:hypothetical protein
MQHPGFPEQAGCSQIADHRKAPERRRLGEEPGATVVGDPLQIDGPARPAIGGIGAQVDNLAGAENAVGGRPSGEAAAARAQLGTTVSMLCTRFATGGGTAGSPRQAGVQPSGKQQQHGEHQQHGAGIH